MRFARRGIRIGFEACDIRDVRWSEPLKRPVVVSRVITQALVREREVFIAESEAFCE